MPAPLVSGVSAEVLRAAGRPGGAPAFAASPPGWPSCASVRSPTVYVVHLREPYQACPACGQPMKFEWHPLDPAPSEAARNNVPGPSIRYCTARHRSGPAT